MTRQVRAPLTTNQEPVESNDLAAFQAALLDLLASPLTPQEMLHHLRTDAAFDPYRDYIDTFELRMVEVAAALTKKWGRREAGTLINEEPVIVDLDENNQMLAHLPVAPQPPLTQDNELPVPQTDSAR